MKTLRSFLTHLPDATLVGTDAADTIYVTNVTGDSRAVQPGSLFVAIAGERFDGHHFLSQVAAQGAVAAVGAQTPAQLAAQGHALPAGLPYIQVNDSRHALALCSAVLHDFPSRAMTVIGITGTDGKTTTSSILESILSAATRTAADPTGRVGVITTVAARLRGIENDTGFHVTTPDAPVVQRFLAEMRDAGCDYAVVESTSHGLAQARVDAVEFDVAAVTNITHEHVDWHGTREKYVAAKALLFRRLYATPLQAGALRCAVLNADDAGSFDALRQALAEEAAQHDFSVLLRCYGMAAEHAAAPHDVTAADVACLPDCTRFTLRWWGGELSMETPLIGEFNVYNILCAATVALALGVAPDAVQQGVADFRGVSGRMERIDSGQPFLAVVDFAHSPASLERALWTLRTLVGTQGDTPGRLIAVFGSAGLRDVAKRRLMGQVSGRLADFTVITAEDPRTEDLNAINRAIAAGVLEHANADAFTIVPDRAAAIQYAVNMAQPGDVVAAFGKGHERSMCFGEIEYPWSDQEAMRSALAARRRDA